MEKKSSLTTLCYIEKDGKYLMLHRVKKENDVNKDKWIGIGGHFEEGESPEECLLREVKEETGLALTSYRFRGLITFSSDGWPTEYMCLYTADGFSGEMTACSEGDLQWVEKERVLGLNLWEGDRIFFMLLNEWESFFSLKLSYRNDVLTEAVLDGTPMELFDVRDRDGNSTGVVKERSLVHRYGDIHGTSHVWIVRPHENGDGGFDVLLQKRSAGKDSLPGCFDPSSAGDVDAGKDYLETALRELWEELGIRAEASELTFFGMHFEEDLTEFYGKPFLNREISAKYLYTKPVDISALHLQAEEVESVHWMDYDECLALLESGGIKNCINLEEYRCIREAAQRVLGLTDGGTGGKAGDR